MLLRPCDQTQSTINYENMDRLNIKQAKERWFRSNQHDLSKSLRLLFALGLLSCTLRKNVFAPHKREIDLYFTFHASSLRRKNSFNFSLQHYCATNHRLHDSFEIMHTFRSSKPMTRSSTNLLSLSRWIQLCLQSECRE